MVFSTKVIGLIISLIELFGIEIENIDLFINLDLFLSVGEFIVVIALLVYLFKLLSKICKNTTRIVELLEKEEVKEEVKIKKNRTRRNF